MGLLNDEQYTSSYINHQVIMGKKGPNKVKQELLQKGISDRLINQYMPVYEEEIQIEHATKLANQVVRMNTKYGPHFIKQKICQHYKGGLFMQKSTNYKIDLPEGNNVII